MNRRLAALSRTFNPLKFRSIQSARYLRSPFRGELRRCLGSLDDKIELNRRMNETLEAMAQAIFRDWFVDFGPTRRKIEGATDPVEIMGGLVTDPERASQQMADMFPASFGDNGLPEGWTGRHCGRRCAGTRIRQIAYREGTDDMALSCVWLWWPCRVPATPHW